MNQTDKGDIVLSFAPFFQIAVLMLQQILVDSNMVVHESFRKVSIILSAIPIVISMFYIVKRKLLLFLMTYLVAFILILTTAIFYISNKQYLSQELFYLLCIIIPCFLCISSVKNPDILKKTILVLSYVIFFLGIIYFSLVWSKRIKFSEYSMSYSYYLLLPSLVFISQKRIIFDIAFILICLMMLLLGSRGALLAAMIYVLSLWIIDSKKKSFIFIIILVFVIFSNSAISLFQGIADNIGISSRTISMLQEGNIAESSSRLKIYSDAWNVLIKGPVLGHGLYGDRVVLNGAYCHNIFLEILIDFGFIIGGGLLLILFFIMFSVYHKSDVEGKKLILMFICFGFLQFLVSGSYLKSPEFGIFLGLLYSQSKIDLFKPEEEPHFPLDYNSSLDLV
jgi:O-antigen ligase